MLIGHFLLILGYLGILGIFEGLVREVRQKKKQQIKVELWI